MIKKYYSLQRMTRGLAFFYVTGIVNYEMRDFSATPRKSHCFIYVSCERITLTLGDGKEYDFKKGNFLYLPLGIRYSAKVFGVEKNGYACLLVSFSLRNKNGDEYYISNDPTVLLESTPESVVKNMLDIADASVNLVYPTFPIAKAFAEMLETVSKQMWLPDIKSDGTNKVLPAIYYLDKHLKDEISVNELAKMCMMSETSFRRAFLEATGFSPAQYKAHIRIKKAKELIRYSPDISTDMLVEELGFTDSSYFYKVFEKVSGETLKQYRKRYK